MSLRELPPDQQITSRWRHLRYVPLVVLIVVGLIVTAIGLVVREQTPETPAAEPAAPIEEAASSTLPEGCPVPAAAPAGDPWSAENAAASEAVWAEHADELGNVYVEGEDGWFFWNDLMNNNFSQSVGRRALSAEELEAWRNYFATLDTTLAADGVELYIVIAPAKWAVYPETLPDWAQALRGPGPLDQLVSVASELPLIDLRDTLVAASDTAQTFSRVNSHWTGYGAATAWNAIAGCIDAVQPDLGVAPLAITGTVIGQDENEYEAYGAAVPEQPDWTDPVFAEPLLPVELTANGAAPSVVEGERWTTFYDLPAETVTEGASSDSRLLYVGDSFGVVMSPYFQQSLAETFQVRHNLDGEVATRPDIVTLARTLKPDVVILEIAQRHLNLPPVQ